MEAEIPMCISNVTSGAKRRQKENILQAKRKQSESNFVITLGTRLKSNLSIPKTISRNGRIGTVLSGIPIQLIVNF